MGFFGLFSATLSNKASSPKNALMSSRDLKDVVAQYKRLRPIRMRLNNKLVERIPIDALKEGAKRIGMLRNETFVFENEDETSVLMDYCVYNVYRKGRNAVEQYLLDFPAVPESDEMACLRAMEHARYTLVAVDRVEPGIGCHVRDLYADETRLLADIGLSRTGQPGAVLATRLLDFDGFVATGGAALPLGILSNDELDHWQQKFRAAVHDERSDPAPLIRACLQGGASSHVRYEGVDTERRFAIGGSYAPIESPAQRRLAHSKLHAINAPANRRCRCGSGKMFKNCCGKR